MVIKIDSNYDRFISLLKRQGAKIRDYQTKAPAVELLDEFRDLEGVEKFIGLNVASLTLGTNIITPREILEKYFKVDITSEILDLFLGFELIEHGDCPDCGGYLEFIDWEENGDLIEAVYGCAVCGYKERNYDAEATRDRRDWDETMRTLNYDR